MEGTQISFGDQCKHSHGTYPRLVGAMNFRILDIEAQGSLHEQQLFKLQKFMGKKMVIPASKIGEIKVDWIGIFTSRNGQNQQVVDFFGDERGIWCCLGCNNFAQSLLL
uniref:Uncharacterized protein n=1 Tax=Romanomermis culicivorax TaxID=13658 RepID=A0A915KKA7_ROMCU